MLPSGSAGKSCSSSTERRASARCNLDVRESRPDALAVHGYKWMCSPTGADLCTWRRVCAKNLRQARAGLAQPLTWREVDTLHHVDAGADRVGGEGNDSGGGLPFPLLYAMEASVDLILGIGPEAVEWRVLDLAASARRRLQALGADAPETGSHIMAAKFAGEDPSKLARELKAQRVLVAARHGYLRVPPHFYNTEEDLDPLEEELRKLLEWGKNRER